MTWSFEQCSTYFQVIVSIVSLLNEKYLDATVCEFDCLLILYYSCFSSQTFEDISIVVFYLDLVVQINIVFPIHLQWKTTIVQQLYSQKSPCSLFKRSIAKCQNMRFSYNQVIDTLLNVDGRIRDRLQLNSNSTLLCNIRYINGSKTYRHQFYPIIHQPL